MGEEYFAILETLNRAFHHFPAAFSGYCSLRMNFLRRLKKIERGTFYTNLDQVGMCPVPHNTQLLALAVLRGKNLP